MLQIRPSCEHCNKSLPNTSLDAMICSFECTFCKECVINILQNVCPNCGGAFEKRPIRPSNCMTGACIEKYPASTEVLHKAINWSRFTDILNFFKDIRPEKR